ncbi:hypothetical protein Tsubulata_000621, partial [Turnera subulata]
METPKEHIARIRRETFSIGGEKNPLAPMLDQAVKYLSAELYSKDVHFLMELIQNAEDNQYLEGVDPSLEFVITSRDITGTGAPATLLMFNNEKGFSPKNIESICNVGNSTKKGNRKSGYIGEKGIGFKSVFLITSQPCIFSNGYHIRFNEKPCPHCNIGYIVPEWVEENPSLSDIQKIYGSSSSLPTTTLVLTLKPDKVKPVKHQLSIIHPEVLLFLSKIKRLSIREENEDPKLNSVSAIAIMKETNFKTRKNFDAESYTLHVSADEGASNSAKECSYYMWRQKFPVRQENKVERRMDVDDWMITLAFPIGERLNRGLSSPGIYAFLPTEMVTNFPFIIQADFILSSSRETILLDNIWNQGILDCVPSAFVNALTSLVKTTDAPVSSLPRMFMYLPVNSSPIPKLNAVREAIKMKLSQEEIVPSESHSSIQKFFHKPSDVGRIMQTFWHILTLAREQGVRLLNLSSHGWFVLNSAFDRPEYDGVLNFLGVGLVNNEWYVKCIQSSNFLMGVPENVYLHILHFIADNWSSKFGATNMGSIPLIKYVEHDGSISLCSIIESTGTAGKKVICRSYVSRQISWLIQWNKEFGSVAKRFFLPQKTQEAFQSFPNKEAVLQWLKYTAKLSDLNKMRSRFFVVKCQLLIAMVLSRLNGKEFLSRLMEANGPPSQSFFFSSDNTSSKWGNILQNGSVLVDIPVIDQDFYGVKISDYEAELKTIGHLLSLAASSTLNRSDMISVLKFITFLKQNSLSPDNFIATIKGGRWLRTSCGNRSPVGSVLYDEGWAVARQISKLPFIDQDYYGEEILCFKSELQLLGIIVGFGGNYQLVLDHLKSPPFIYSLTAEDLPFILDCIHYSTSREKLIKALETVKCLKTNAGYKYPGECFLFDPEWGCLLDVFSGFPLLDDKFYGSCVFSRKAELKQLGVKVEFEEAVRVFEVTFRQKASKFSIPKESVLSFLSCRRKLKGTAHKFPSNLKKSIREEKWLQTRLGDYRSPRQCILFGPEWESVSEIAHLPFIDDGEKCYGEGIHEYRKELRGMGVVVELKDGVKFVAAGLSFPSDPSSVTPAQVYSWLKCIRILLQEKDYSFRDAFHRSNYQGWLKTYAGYRNPDKCCWFDCKWDPVLKPTDGPFIDEEFYGSNIRQYKKELGATGVIGDVKGTCSLLATHMVSLSEFSSILRIYNFLSEQKWYPDSDETIRIWIPEGDDNGKWVSPEECVRHDKEGHFGLLLNVLDKYYEPKLLFYFSSAFAVKSNASLDDYCKVWKVWEDSGCQLSHAQCFAFWRCVLTHWNSKTQKKLAGELMKVPVFSGSGDILLVDKSDAFIADDLLLKEIFSKPSSRPIFVWYPQPSLPSLTHSSLVDVYSKIGVRRISESVQKEEVSLADGVELEQVNPREHFLRKGLVRLILGFLANPSMCMDAKERQQAVQCLLNLTLLKTSNPIAVCYSLPLSSGEVLNVEASRLIRWDRHSSKFFTQKLDRAGGRRTQIEYATFFSEIIAKGVLWDKEDHISALAELIKFAVLLDFNDGAIKFLMSSKNLQVFVEDEEFLSAAFPSENGMETPKEHIARIRRETFSIGGEKNPLAPMLDQAVKYLSAELYSKDVHFLMELIQNAEDNQYLEGVDPSLEFVITSRDITGTGAPATLLMFNNEKGFSAKNIESICNVGNSTKKGNRKSGYIGEKGIGFKSVFLITSQPCIFSNGYQIRFNEKPCPHCNLGYIVPEWVEENPSVSDIRKIYGSSSSLPTTTLVLPLKPDKVKPVKHQLSIIHPEVLLFLAKIKRLSIREDNEDPKLNTVSAIAIMKETNFKTRKNIDAESFTLHLSADEGASNFEKECSYYMWRQKFPVRQENKVERRMDVDDWMITLAFPTGERLNRGLSSPGIYAFLPTEMVTNFPFIIQADFILSSSRETILLDNIWNQGILDCVPSAFVNALTSLVKMTDAPISSLPRMFLYLPVNSSPVPKLNAVREAIKMKLSQEEIVPSESHSSIQKFFHKPSDVGRIMQTFWHILTLAREQGVRLLNLSSHGWYVLNSAFDRPEYDGVLNFLGVGLVNNEWYVKCIQSSNFLMGVRENVYLHILHFIADNWSSKFGATNMGSIPLIKYVEHDGSISLCSIIESAGTVGNKVICRSYVSRQISWLIQWNKEFRSVANIFFLPQELQEALQSFPNKEAVLQWLKYTAKLSDLNKMRSRFFVVKCQLLIAMVLSRLNGKEFLSRLMEANGPPSQSFFFSSDNTSSKWGNILQNGSVLVDIPVIDQDFYGVKISDYEAELKTIGVMFEYREACEFIGKHLLSLAASSTLNRSHMISVLKFITFLKQNSLSPDNFIATIKGGRWLRTSCGNRSPVGSVLYDEGWAVARKISKLPFIDQDYYGEEILCFKSELQLLGIIVGFGGNYQLVLDHLKSPPFIYSLTAEDLPFILDCMHYSISREKLIKALETVKCLRTNAGYKCPGECFLFDPEWGCLLDVFSGFPLLDDKFYGSCVFSRTAELKQLGVKVEFEEAVRVFEVTFRQKASKFSIPKESVLSFLSCRRKLKGTAHKFPSNLKKSIREEKWLQTRLGDYRSPRQCILFGPEWESVSEIAHLPFIDDGEKCYGKGIHEYQKELRGMGVVVELKDGVKFVAASLSFPSDPSSVTPAQVYSWLKCIQISLQEKDYSFPYAFHRSNYQGWLKTYAGYRTPDKCCLFDCNWASVLKPTDGPFIDEEFYGSNIRQYKKELGATGVIGDVKGTCSLLATHMVSLSEFSSILRIYNFLSEQKWYPDSDETKRIWIPEGDDNGKWVSPEECVRHDKEGHFGLLLNVLDKYYEPKLLFYFSSAFAVKSNASLDDYCKVWKVWEDSGCQLSHAQCYAFWRCVLTHWNSKTQKKLAGELMKMPVFSGSGDILLVDKSDAFIADDLLLKEIFSKPSSRPIFVWYPQPSLPSLTHSSLVDVYSKIGVRRISESVQKEEVSLADGVELEQVNPREHFLRKGLVRLILGFLANPSMCMDAKERQQAVQCLLNLTLLKTSNPIAVSYSLALSSGEVLNVEASRLIRWDRHSSKFFTQKLDRAGGRRTQIEYATFFSEIIAKGILWDKEDHISALAELIKFAVFVEDEEFLSASFPSENG